MDHIDHKTVLMDYLLLKLQNVVLVIAEKKNFISDINLTNFY